MIEAICLLLATTLRKSSAENNFDLAIISNVIDGIFLQICLQGHCSTVLMVNLLALCPLPYMCVWSNYITGKGRPFCRSPCVDLGIFTEDLLKPGSNRKDSFTGSHSVLNHFINYLKILRPKHKPFEFFTRNLTIHLWRYCSENAKNRNMSM